MINLGTIGTNWITQKFIDAIKLTTDYNYTSVYSRSEDTALKFAAKNGAKNTFTNLNDFLSSDTINTVYIASPNSKHYEQAILAIENGKNIIVEKPAFSNPEEMESIQALLKKHPNVLYFEAARNIHTPNFAKIRKQVQKMEVISGAEFTYSKYSSRYDAVLNGEEPNVFSLNFGGGALHDLGVYTLYDALDLFGEPNKVAYHPQIIKSGVAGKGTAILTYSDKTVVLNFSKITNSLSTSEIYGLKDLISMDDAGELTHVEYIDANGSHTDISAPMLTNPMLPEAHDFARIIQDPNDKNNENDYHRWNELSILANKVLFELRQNANLKFSFEN